MREFQSGKALKKENGLNYNADIKKNKAGSEKAPGEIPAGREAVRGIAGKTQDLGTSKQRNLKD